MRKHLDKTEASTKLRSILSMPENTIVEKLGDFDISEEFLHMCIEYRNEKINEDLINTILPLTIFSIIIKCPFYIGNRKMGVKLGQFFGRKEKEVILSILKRNKMKSVSMDDLRFIVAGEDLRTSAETLMQVLDFFSEEVTRESDTNRHALLLIKNYFEVHNKTKDMIVSSSNNILIVGKDNLRVYNLRFVDDDELSESYFDRFRNSMFINGLTTLDRSNKKNVISSTVLVKSNGILPVLMWKIPYNLLELLGETPESLIKKYISKNFYYLVNGDYFNFPEYRNTAFCPYCGYNKSEYCKTAK